MAAAPMSIQRKPMKLGSVVPLTPECATWPIKGGWLNYIRWRTQGELQNPVSELFP